MKKTVLIVDDDRAVRNSIRKVLELAGYAVSAAADGDQASVFFDPDKIDLVLLDLNLPLESGWDVFERLSTRFPLVPVIIITGMAGQYPTAQAAGVSAFMEKPVAAPVLLKTLNEVLAEPRKTLLRRMCGRQHDTRHLPAPKPPANGHSAQPALHYHRGTL